MFSNYPTDDAGLDYYTCVTLIDITKTNAVRHYNTSMPDSESDYNLKRNQHRNYQTMLQVIGLRCQPVYLTDPVKYVDRDLAELGFGSDFTKETVWAYSFGVEQQDIFLTDEHPFGLLLEDLHNVPIILELMESAAIEEPMLDLFGIQTINTIIFK